MNKVTSGEEADQIAWSDAPEEMRWVVVQLLIKYLDGEEAVRAQLLETTMFNGISKGNQDVGLPFLSYTPSPHLDDIRLLPGEQSLGYLVFLVYEDDPAPLLHFRHLDEEHFFRTDRWRCADCAA